MCSRVEKKTCGRARLTLVSLVWVFRTIHSFCILHSSTDSHKNTKHLTSGVSLSVQQFVIQLWHCNQHKWVYNMSRFILLNEWNGVPYCYSSSNMNIMPTSENRKIHVVVFNIENASNCSLSRWWWCNSLPRWLCILIWKDLPPPPLPLPPPPLPPTTTTTNVVDLDIIILHRCWENQNTWQHDAGDDDGDGDGDGCSSSKSPCVMSDAPAQLHTISRHLMKIENRSDKAEKYLPKYDATHTREVSR